MKIFLSGIIIIFSATKVTAQPIFNDVSYIYGNTKHDFNSFKIIDAIAVQNQGKTGTCWSFSTTSLVESQCFKNVRTKWALSEMYTVRNIYIEKAYNYILRQGHAQFGEGALGHDVIRSIAMYGTVPDDEYSGLLKGEKSYDHQKMAIDLKKYLDSILNYKPLDNNWINGYTKILDDNMGIPPTEFMEDDHNDGIDLYNNKYEIIKKKYTPLTFAKEQLKFNADDYINITSFTHHPFYEPFILEVSDNFSNGSYYNLPLTEMIELAKNAIDSGYSLMWDTDISNNGFKQDKGLALLADKTSKPDDFKADMKEQSYDQDLRQQLFMNLTTQDDHLMHIIGTEKSKGGKTFFIVKNSWGEVGPFKGYINVSEPYFAVNTVSLVVPKAALSKALLAKLKIK